MTDIVFEDLDIFAGSIDGSDFLLFGSGGNQVASKPDREDFQLTMDKLFDYFADRYNREERFVVGDLYVTQSTDAPSTRFGGTWVLLSAESNVIAGTSSTVNAAGSTTTSGSNTPTVPTPQHTHSATFSGNALPSHSHGDVPYLTNDTDRGSGNSSYFSLDNKGSTQAVSAGTPSGSVTVANAGTSGATLDVRGKRIYFYHWLKTA